MKDEKVRKAVALKYDPKASSAPSVVAKGAGEIAENIIKKGKEAGVNLYEDQTLVQLLHQLEIHEKIPEKLYPIVAEVFAVVYQAESMARRMKHEE